MADEQCPSNDNGAFPDPEVLVFYESSLEKVVSLPAARIVSLRD
jgi:hypothetical protein